MLTCRESDMRLAENPPNPFAHALCEWQETPPLAEITVHEERARSILTENDSPDIPFRWSVNPYRGCQHGCAYCYARRTHEYLDLGAGTDFDTQIFVKVNAPELLAAELRRRGWKREQISFSGVTDCYQPLEARYRLTRRCLEVCAELANPVGIVTKSFLVARDADLLAELHRRCAAHVFFSIAFADDALARKIEPWAPTPSRRFEAMRRLHAAGVPVGLIVAPVIPGLNDRDIPALLARGAASGASAADYTPVRLPGSVADVFLTRLRRELPDAAERIEARIRDMRDGRLNNPEFGGRMHASGAYWESIQRLFETMAARTGLRAWRCDGTPAEPDAPPEAKQLELFR
jgi:DNA repair photolyase